MILNCLKEAGLLDGFSPVSVGSNVSTTDNHSDSRKRKVSSKSPMRIPPPRQVTQIQKLSISSQPSDKSKILIRIHECGKLGVQLVPFKLAQENIFRNTRSTHDRIIYQTINNDEIRKWRWSPEQLVNWLLDSQIHFIMSHCHQGMNIQTWNPSWNDVLNLRQELYRLKDHIGYPSGEDLKCLVSWLL